MTTAIVAILCISLLIWTAILFFGGAYVFYRGRSNASPLPPAVERIVNPPANPAPEPQPSPPAFPCPHCTKPANYTLSKDQTKWTCKECSQSIPNVRLRIGV